MITLEQAQQAIKETAKGMLSGDPDYSAQCVQTREGGLARVFELSNNKIFMSFLNGDSAQWKFTVVHQNGQYLLDGDSRFDLVSAFTLRRPRRFRCWLRFAEDNIGEIYAVACTSEAYKNEAAWSRQKWLTDPVEFFIPEKLQP